MSAIGVLLLFFLVSVLGPWFAYLIFRSRAARRSDAACGQFVGRQRRHLAAYYVLGAVIILLLALGLGTYYYLTGKRSGEVASYAAMASAAFVVFWGGLGTSLVRGFVIAARAPVPGCCEKCDYDLRGITTGRCPECGHPC